MTSKNKNKIIDINKEKNNNFFKSQNTHKKINDLEKTDINSVNVNLDSKSSDSKSEDSKSDDSKSDDSKSELYHYNNKSDDLNSNNKSGLKQVDLLSEDLSSELSSDDKSSDNKSEINQPDNKSKEIVLNNRLIRNRTYDTSKETSYNNLRENKNYKINLTRNIDMNNFNNMRNLIINKTSQFKENIYRLDEIQIDRRNQNNYIEISDDKLKELLELAKSRNIEPNNIKYIDKFNNLPVNVESNKSPVNVENKNLPDNNKDITQKDVIITNENFITKFFKNLSFPEFLGLSLVIILLAIFIGNSLRKMTQNVDLSKMLIKPFLKDQG